MSEIPSTTSGEPSDSEEGASTSPPCDRPGPDPDTARIPGPEKPPGTEDATLLEVRGRGGHEGDGQSTLPPTAGAEAPHPPPTERETVAGKPDTVPSAPGPGVAGRNTLGPYTLLEEIGRGGMGVVYKAEHASLNRKVALKVLIAGEDASEEAIARFLREASAVAKLGHHPHIVPVFDIGQDGRLHYFAMHFVQGEGLDHRLDRGDLSPHDAAMIARQVALALAHAHSHGVLHRDLKPANILLSRTADSDRPPSPMLTDFGLARDVSNDERMTRTGTTMGSPNYMSPEQADGRVDDVDERTDVWGLGATLYEMLAAKPPFEGTTVVNVLKAVILDEPAPPHRHMAAVPRDLETICLKCLEKDPARRYPSAVALADDLRRFLEHEPIKARPASVANRLAKRVRRNPAVYLTATAGVLAVLAMALFFLVAQPLFTARAKFAAQTRALHEARERRLRPETDARRRLARAQADFDAGRFDDCASACAAIDSMYGPRHGQPFTGIDASVDPARVKEEFPVLLKPCAYPLAQAAVLRARALEASGTGDAGAWAAAYWRARQGSAPGEGPTPEDLAVIKESLVKIGNHLLARGEFRRAAGVFEEVLQRFPRGDRGLFLAGLAHAKTGMGQLDGARVALEQAIGADGDPDAARAGAEDALALLSTLAPSTVLSAPVPPKVCTTVGLVPIDLDGDGRDALVTFRGETDGNITLTVFDWSENAFGTRFEQSISPVGPWRGAHSILRVLPAEFDEQAPPELLFCLNNRTDDRTTLGVLGWDGSEFHLRGTHEVALPNFLREMVAGQLDAGGPPEVVLVPHVWGSNVLAFRWTGQTFEELGRLSLASFCYGAAIAPTPAGPRLLLAPGPYQDYTLISADPKEGWNRPAAPPGPRPFHSIISCVTPFGGTRAAFIAGRHGLPSDWRLPLANRGVDPSRFLAPGLYVTDIENGHVGRAEPVLLDGRLARMEPRLLTWEFDGRRRFAVLDQARLHVGPVHWRPEKADWVVIDHGAAQHEGVVLEADGDPAPEIVVFRGNQTLRLFGAGEEGGAGLAEGPDRTGESAGDPLLAIAYSLAEMGQAREAARVFAEVAQRSDVEEVRGAALCGRADALAQLGIVADALVAYDRALAVASARARAFMSKAWCLEKAERWGELKTFLENGLRAGSLPENVADEASRTLARITPRAQWKTQYRLFDDQGLHPASLCLDPLAVSKTDDGWRLYSDGSRPAGLFLPVRYSGEGFRIRASFSVDRFEWANMFSVGVLGGSFASAAGCIGPLVSSGGGSSFYAWFDPGDAFSFPECICTYNAAVGPFGRPEHAHQESLIPYPPPLPVRFHIEMAYLKNQDRLRVTLRDDDGRVVYADDKASFAGLAAGNLVLGAETGKHWNENVQWEMWRSAITVHEFRVDAPRIGDISPDSAAPHAEELLARANAHALSGRRDRALALFDRALATAVSEAERGTPKGCLGPLPRWPGVIARTHLFRGVALFRMNRPVEGGAAVEAALRAEPARVLFLLARDAPDCDRAVATFLGKALAAVAQRPDWPKALLAGLAAEGWLAPDATSRLEEILNDREARADGRMAWLAQAMLLAWHDADVVAPCFRGTPLEPTLAKLRLDRAEALAWSRRTVADVYGLSRFENYLRDYPDDPRGLNGLAWFLATCPRPLMRDGACAVRLAKRAVGLAEGGPPETLATYLDTLGAAYFEAGDRAAAIAAQKRALAVCPPDKADLMKELQDRLATYQK